MACSMGCTRCTARGDIYFNRIQAALSSAGRNQAHGIGGGDCDAICMRRLLFFFAANNCRDAQCDCKANKLVSDFASSSEYKQVLRLHRRCSDRPRSWPFTRFSIGASCDCDALTEVISQINSCHDSAAAALRQSFESHIHF
jgi:hypothetical protein